MAHATTTDYGGARTKDLILEAIKNSQRFLGRFPKPMLFADSGVENLNKHVDNLVDAKIIERTIAQIDVSFSNSMIECFFRRLKHGYLYLQKQGNFELLVKHLNFYIKEHNESIPHAAFSGGTPLEVFTGEWNEIRKKVLDEHGLVAIRRRKGINQAQRCGACIA